jgi:asparagine synthase (glutamine-hydrolysing)
MSGIAGIVNLNQARVERRLLQRLADFLAFRGPDAQETWIDHNFGFAHTSLRTTFESEHEHQPFTLDGKVWIVADARVDARKELIAELAASGRILPPEATDVELILRAYHAWGESCVEHLLGDFAFGIWDSREQCLFCARDHMGVKPFYYAHIGPVVIFSNTLDCVRLHPAVSDRLNDLAVADFLLFEGNQNPATTTLADIQRLAPAHRATWSSAGLKLSRYWTLPIDEPVFYRRADDYVDRFKELLRQAVTDRLRTKRVGILMSGGLDSPTLAATTRDLLCERHGSADLKAFTSVGSYGPDERHYAGLVARRLDIPIQFQVDENKPVDLNWERKRIHTAEPATSPWGVPAAEESWREMGTYSRVFFYGEGPDNALRFEWQPYFRYLLRQCRGGAGSVLDHGKDGRATWYARLLQAFFSVAVHGPIPFWGRIPRKIEKLASGWNYERNFPVYLNPALESRLSLRARWEEFQRPLTSAHPVRPRGYASMLIPLWQFLFESLDAGWTHSPVEVRHPYVDLRMLRFLLAVPALPWCRCKYLLRRAMRGVLPRPVLRRGKEGVPLGPIVKRLNELAVFPFVSDPELCYYVDVDGVQKAPSEKIWTIPDRLRVRALNYWLQNSRSRLEILPTEDLNHERFPGSATALAGEKAVSKAAPPSLR